MKRRAFWVCALALPATAHHQRGQHASRAGLGWPLAPFELHDHHGAPLTLARLHGRWTFLLLGDTRCTEACAAPLAALAGLRRRIAGTQALAALQVVLISLDPQQDGAALRAVLAPFDASFIGATGDAVVLRRLVDDLALAHDADPRGALVLIGPDAVLRVEYLPPFDVQLLTADFLTVRSRR